ncbi:origin recognition complex subunit 4 C-terminus-domain-containing protein [Melanogaster broomeanus]|nr:origin recognition complex subunit 4 C-terminus-domain-containing protein [Melanogaster broomeanus]
MPGRTAQPSSPRKGRDHATLQSQISLPDVLPVHLAPCLRSQKRAILAALRSHSLTSEDSSDEEQFSTNATAYAQLQDLLVGTVTRGEGNSCLLLGPRGSGKTTLVERAIKALQEKLIVLRLSGYAQHNDRLALREIARQLSQQTGKTFLHDNEDDADKEFDPFFDPGPSVALPPPSHLPALISVLPTLSRPTVVILDAFDLFAQHARQSLLYCLLDTVQSCRVGQGNNGLAVIGVTTRIDTINLLEKRVKSRFSGRMIRTAPPSDLHRWINFSRHILCTPIDGSPEWNPLWTLAVNRFFEDRKVTDMLKDTFTLTRDVRMLKQILTAIVVNLETSSPFLTSQHLSSAISAQRGRQQFSNLHALSYPSICLLIAAMHVHTAGHDVITFEMLHDTFREQFRASSAAPIQIEGGSIGMARCTREGFEQLLAARMFTSVAASSSSITSQFVRYRCLVEREDVKHAVNMMGQTNLKKWLHKGP